MKNVLSLDRKLGGGTVVAVDPLASVDRDHAVGRTDLLHLAAIDLLQELGERELGRRRVAAARIDAGGHEAAHQKCGRDDVSAGA